MSSKVLALGVITVAASASVAMSVTPHAAGGGRKATFGVFPENTAAADADQVGDIQGSNDGGSTWTNVQAYAAADGVKFFELELYKLMRVNNTAGTAGGGTNFYVFA